MNKYNNSYTTAEELPPVKFCNNPACYATDETYQVSMSHCVWFAKEYQPHRTTEIWHSQVWEPFDWLRGRYDPLNYRPVIISTKYSKRNIIKIGRLFNDRKTNTKRDTPLPGR